MTPNELNFLHDRVRDAEETLESAINEYFQPGLKVSYRHGENWRYGSVERAYCGRLRIYTPTGKLIWIDAYKVYSELKAATGSH